MNIHLGELQKKEGLISNCLQGLKTTEGKRN
jgi:hypothetical protein